MAEKLDPKEVASFEEVLLGEVLTNQALINLLVQKGLLTESELLEEIQRIRG